MYIKGSPCRTGQVTLLIKCVLQRCHNTLPSGKYESRVLQDWIKVSLFPFHSFKCGFVPVELSWGELTFYCRQRADTRADEVTLVFLLTSVLCYSLQISWSFCTGSQENNSLWLGGALPFLAASVSLFLSVSLRVWGKLEVIRTVASLIEDLLCIQLHDGQKDAFCRSSQWSQEGKVF